MKLLQYGIATFLLLSSLGANAQTEKKEMINDSEKKVVSTKSRDLFMIQLHHDNWAKKPESIKMKDAYNRGFSAYALMDFPFKKAPNFSFAAGLGVGTYNYYFDKQRMIINEGKDAVEFRDMTTAETEVFGKVKFNTVYAEAPFEIRYFSDKYNRNKGFKFAVGMKVGYLLGVHTKEKVKVDGVSMTQKFGNVKVYNPAWTFSPTVRIGWGNFSVFAQYQLNNMFNQGAGPEMNPYSIGITISGM